MKAFALCAALTSTLLTSQADAAGADAVAFKHVDTEAVAAFATKFFYKRHPHAVNWSFAKRYRSDENWAEIVRDQVYMAEADLNGDGVAELILVVDNPNWCEAGGCLGAIFRHAAKGYELICEASLPAPTMPPLRILPAVENGYHRLATADQTILWNERQDYDSGMLCATEASN